jgi:hypothetical protein
MNQMNYNNVRNGQILGPKSKIYYLLTKRNTKHRNTMMMNSSSSKPSQAYAVVTDDHDSIQHVAVVHGEAIRAPILDKRKRELCIAFTAGLAVGLILVWLSGGSSGNMVKMPQVTAITPGIDPLNTQDVPPATNITGLPPLVPPPSNDEDEVIRPPKEEKEPSDDSAKESSWWSEATETVSSWFGGSNESHDTKTVGGGRDWLVNAQTGTVASKLDPSYLLGVGPAPLVLVHKEDAKQRLLFLQAPSRTVHTVDLVAHDNEFVGFEKDVSTQVEGFAYFDTVASPFVDPVSVTYKDDNFLVFADDYVLDVALWQIVENQPVNFVQALDGSTFTAGGGRDWIWNENGSISPKLNLELVLGMGSRGLVITQKKEQALRLSHAQELANGETVPMELSGEIKVIGVGETQSTADGNWRYMETVLVEDTPVRIQYDGNFILTPNQDFCLDIAYWKLEEGNVVNFVGGD